MCVLFQIGAKYETQHKSDLLFLPREKCIKKEYGDLIIPIVFSLRNKKKACATRTSSVRRGGHPICEQGHARKLKIFLLGSLCGQTLLLLGMFLLMTKTHTGSLIYHGLSSQVSSCWPDWRAGRYLAAGEDCAFLGDANISFEGDQEALFLTYSCNCLFSVPCALQTKIWGADQWTPIPALLLTAELLLLATQFFPLQG